MPTLPTLEVTDEQANRMLDAYGSIDNYLNWLKREIIEFVVDKESAARRVTAFQQIAEEASQARIDLGLHDIPPV